MKKRHPLRKALSLLMVCMLLFQTAGFAYAEEVDISENVYEADEDAEIEVEEDSDDESTELLNADDSGDTDGIEIGSSENVPVTTAEVSVLAVGDISDGFIVVPTTAEVASNEAESYGYTDDAGKVTTLDVLAHIHSTWNEGFASNPTDYLVVSDTGYITKLFGNSTSNCSFTVNDVMPNDGTVSEGGYYNGYLVTQAEVKDNDDVRFFLYQDTSYFLDNYGWFADENGDKVSSYTATVNEPLNLKVKGYESFAYFMATTQVTALEDVTVMSATAQGVPDGTVVSEPTDEDGNTSVTFTEAGTYYLVLCGDEYTPLITNMATVTVEAAEEPVTPADPATVNVSIFNKGEIAVMQKDIEVTDYNVDGQLNVDDALYAAHEAAYTGGAEAGYQSAETSYGLSIQKLWGDESGSYGYWLNDASCWSLSDTVKEGDSLVAFVYQDATGWSDAYARFSPTSYTANKKEAFTVSVEKAGYDESWNTVFSAFTDVSITAYDTDGKALPESYYTAEGCQVTFKKAGDFVIAARGTGSTILVPALAKVHIEETAVTGTLSGSVSWAYEDGELTISGKGTTPTSYASNKRPPFETYKDQIESVVIEDGITVLGKYTFYKYENLKHVTLPDTLSNIGNNAFMQSGIEEIDIPENVTTVGSSAFSGCKSLKKATTSIAVKNMFNNCSALEEVVLREGMTTIGDTAFNGCSALTSVTIPSTVTGLTANALRGASNLAEVKITGSNYVTKDGIIYSADEKTVLIYPAGKEGKASIPNGVTEIGDYAFYGSSKLTEVSLPGSLTTIGSYAFCGSGITELDLPDSVTEAGTYAFSDCDSLLSVKLSGGLTELSANLFRSCEILPAVSIPDGVETIGASAFAYCDALASIDIPDSVETIGANAFQLCKALIEVTIPDKVTVVAASLFAGCENLEKVVLPAGITEIGNTSLSSSLNVKLNEIFFKGTLEQWSAISMKDTIDGSKVIIIGTDKLGNQETAAPVIESQPADYETAQGGDSADALKIQVKAEEGAVYSFNWYVNTEKSISGASSVAVKAADEDGVTSTYTPSSENLGNSYYFCIVTKIDAEGAATYTYSDYATVAVTSDLFTGSGTEKNPYKINNTDDLATLKTQIEQNSYDTSGIYFEMTNDIELAADWEPIGTSRTIAFKGTFLGNNYTVTIPEGGLPLFNYVVGAKVSDLNIYGEKIAGSALVNNYKVINVSGVGVEIENVTLKSGSSTLKSGFINDNFTSGYAAASLGYKAVIRNCVIEEGVTIGYDQSQSYIGSFGGRLQGTIENCVSYAEVYGVNYVGGILGMKDNAMGVCDIKNCTFGGKVEASGEHVGGVAGGVYDNNSAPNAIRLSLHYNTVTGTVIGKNKVGGILGGDSFVAQAWNEYAIIGNSFTGTVSATDGNYVGGLIGYYMSLNKFDDIADNYYDAACGTEKAFGFVQYVDTSCETHETNSGALYFSTKDGVADCPSVTWCSWKTGLNREDDPLGADLSKLATNDESFLHVHSYSKWKTVSEATVFAKKVQERTCSCGETQTREVGSVLTPTIKLNATSIKMQVKQSTTKFKVTNLANGDSVKSYKSSNTKIVTVSKTGKLTAKKKGTAYVKVTLASGKTAKLKVKVQKGKVKTTKLSSVPTKATLKVGKTLKLSPVVTPITSQEKVTYTTSSKKIATVSKSGKITAKKKGTATITVKSGSVTKTIKITVK